MSILEAIDIGARSLYVHGKRLDIATKNMANIDTPNYVRKIPCLNSVDDVSFEGIMNSMKEDMFSMGNLPYLQGGVALTKVVEDPTLGEKIYRPGHPDADENGYIRTSNVNPMVEMADATMAQRAYEANLAVIQISKSMATRATQIGQ